MNLVRVYIFIIRDIIYLFLSKILKLEIRFIIYPIIISHLFYVTAECFVYISGIRQGEPTAIEWLENIEVRL